MPEVVGADAEPGATGKVRVFLVDDHHLFLSGVRAELGDAVEVVGDADEVGAAIELIGHNIVNTDVVDDGFILNKFPDRSLDFVIANHALEHSPDPYGTLLRWRRKLRRRGLLYFALPIAEKCYDRGRPLTSLDHLIEDHRLFTALATDQILEVTREHLREFMQISDANIRRMNEM